VLLLFRSQPAHATRGGWQWPTSPVAVSRQYIAPATEYSTGHRGIDLRSSAGTSVSAIAEGHVSFVGAVAGTLIVSISHQGGWISTYLPVVSRFALNQHVSAGEVIGALAADTSHCSCLHLGLRFHGLYVSPLIVLGEIPRSVLLPW
jgi:murein DD-endopeptidase MepM/ murein hydrolase activator NlpD